MNIKLVFVLILVLLVLSFDVNLSQSSSDFSEVASPNEGWVLEKVSETAFTGDWTTSLALDSNYSPHISYFDNSEAYHRLQYVRRSGSTWVEEPVDYGLYGYVGWPSSIVIDTKGNIHIGYGSNNQVRYVNRIEGNWVIEVVDSRPETWFQDVSLAIGGDSVPHMSYYDWDTGEVWYAYKNSSKVWVTELVSLDAIGVAALTWHTKPKIAYQGKDGIQFYSGSITTIANEGDISHHALAVTPNGTACIVYDGTESLQYACESEWKKEKISDSGSGGALGFSESGQPHVIYHDNGLMYATRLGGKWVSVPIEVSGERVFGSYVSNLVFVGNTKVCFLFIDGSGDLIYACGSSLIEVDLVADKIEVTQAAQDLKNSIPLVEGKRTFVRFHVHSSEYTFPTTAQLKVTGDAGTTRILPINPGGNINVRPKPDRKIKDHAFLFELPVGYTEGNVKLEAEVNPDLALGRNIPEKDYTNNKVPVSVNFEQVPTIPLVLFDVSYTSKDVEGTIYVFKPSGHSYYLASWLRRAFPLSELRLWHRSLNLGEERENIFTCQEINAALSQQRAWDGLFFWRDIPSNARYYGLVNDNPEGYGRKEILGCASGIPSFIASGPTGPTHLSSYNNWDIDKVYGDWVAGHYLSQTYGIAPVACDNISTEKTGENAVFGFDPLDKLTLYHILKYQGLRFGIYPPDWNDVKSTCWSKIWIGKQTTRGLMDFFQSGSTSGNGAQGAGAIADRLLVSGSILPDSGQAQIQPLFVLSDVADSIPRTPGDYAIVLRDKGGNQLARYALTPSESFDGAGLRILFFTELVPYQSRTDIVEIEGPDGVLTSVQAGSANPTVTLGSPNGGEVLTGDSVTVSWTGNDPDGDPLTYKLQYSPDNGASWMVLAENHSETTVEVDTMNLVAGDQVLFRVWVSDGIHTAYDQSDASFTLPNRTPQVEIFSPDQEVTIAISQTLSLQASVYDPDIGTMETDQIGWVSDLDGTLGNGSPLGVTGLSVGTHTITLQADDSVGGISTDEVQVTVVADLNELPPLPNWLIAGPLLVSFMPGEGLTQTTLSVDNQNLAHSIAWNSSSSQPWVQLSEESGETPYDDLYASYQDTGLASGVYTATITITSPDVPEQELELDVMLEISGYSLYLPLLER